MAAQQERSSWGIASRMVLVGKCCQDIQLFEGQSRTDGMNQIALEKKVSLYNSHSDSLYPPWWISFI
jgi:hypothetical protein